MSMHESELHDAKPPNRRRFPCLASAVFYLACAMRAPPPPRRGRAPPPRGPTPRRGRRSPKAGPPPRPSVKQPGAKPRSARKLPGWLARAQRLLLKPTQEWATIAGEFTSAGPLYVRYLVPMAAIGPVAATIGGIVFGERGSLLTFGTVPMDAGTAVQAGGPAEGLKLVRGGLPAVGGGAGWGAGGGGRERGPGPPGGAGGR